MARKKSTNPDAKKKSGAELSEDELKEVTGGGLTAAATSTSTSYNTTQLNKGTIFLTHWSGCMANKVKR